MQAPKKAAKEGGEEKEVKKTGPLAKEGEKVFGVAHIFASFNDTFVVSAAARWRSPRPPTLPSSFAHRVLVLRDGVLCVVHHACHPNRLPGAQSRRSD